MATSKYVDGFVIVIPKKNTEDYKKMAKDAKKVWLKFGALNYKECMGEDLKPGMGQEETVPFPKLTGAGPNEAVWFSYIEFKNKKHRDSVNKKVMKFFEEKYGDTMEMPFEMKKLSYGGFTVEVG